MSPFDPDQLLRSANPVDETRLFAPSESAAAQRLFEKITGVGYLPRPEPPYRRRWRVYVTSVLAAVAVGGGVAYAVIALQPTKRADVGCYDQPSLTAGTKLVVSSGGPDAIAVCQAAWKAGRTGGQPSPNLVACRLPSGGAGVFPAADSTDDVCRRLGLPALDRQAPISAVVGLRDRLVPALQAACLSGSQAEALAHRELLRAGLQDWTVTITSPFTPARPCASPGFDESGRRVVIVAIPPRTSG
jgi:hypothetical protein